MIEIVPLGAGQDVGRSCIIMSIGNKRIMFDCGMHMAFEDERKFPDFTCISKDKNFDKVLDCVIVTHFHLDHCGALPYFTEMCGYNGPIYMTHPTKAICPILLEDYRKIAVDKKGDTNFFTCEDIENCMQKVIGINLYEVIKVDDALEIKAYYAGHVLGAAMFHVRVGDESAVYTGDYNMTPDRHLGSASIDRLKPDILITESTYATTLRDSRKARERDFLNKVHSCVDQGGKVLIPVFALGRAQELCILIESYWERVNLKVPIYFSPGLTEQANYFYKVFIDWTNQNIKDALPQRNKFEFAHIKLFERHMADQPGPMVLFASPGMLHSGNSLEVFKKWAPDEKNMVVIPGYCVPGTVGAKILSGAKQIETDKNTTIKVNLQIKNLSFSAHADSKGIMQLIRQCEPRNVMLVHGEKSKMAVLKDEIMHEFNISCYDPPNGAIVLISTAKDGPLGSSTEKVSKEAYEADRAKVSLAYRDVAALGEKRDLSNEHTVLEMYNNTVGSVDPHEALHSIKKIELSSSTYYLSLEMLLKATRYLGPDGDTSLLHKLLGPEGEYPYSAILRRDVSEESDALSRPYGVFKYHFSWHHHDESIAKPLFAALDSFMAMHTQ